MRTGKRRRIFIGTVAGGIVLITVIVVLLLRGCGGTDSRQKDGTLPDGTSDANEMHSDDEAAHGSNTDGDPSSAESSKDEESENGQEDKTASETASESGQSSESSEESSSTPSDSKQASSSESETASETSSEKPSESPGESASEKPSESSSANHQHSWVEVKTTIHHDAEYIHHDAEYQTVHHDAEYTTVHHDAEYTTQWVEDKPAWDEQVLVKEAWDETVTTTKYEVHLLCNCGFDFSANHCSDSASVNEHTKAHALNGEFQYGNTHTETIPVEHQEVIHHDAEYTTVHHDAEGHNEQVLVQEAWDESVKARDAWDEQVVTKAAWDEKVKDAWDETAVTGYKCSECGASK